LTRPNGLFESKDESLYIDLDNVSHVVWVDPIENQQPQRMLWVYFISGCSHKLHVVDGMAFVKQLKKYHFEQWKNLEDDSSTQSYDPSPHLLRDFVSRRLNEMGSHPGMWASTKESFIVQVALLIELLLGRPAALDFEKGIANNSEDVDERLEDVWARYVISNAKGILLKEGLLT
jgi:hypothetical protein